MGTIPKQLKLEGLNKASNSHHQALMAARFVAELIGAKKNTVTCDDVFLWIAPEAVGRAAGNIFRNGPWEFSHWQESERESNHARPLRAWRLK